MCWSFYYVKDNTQIDFEYTQIIHCILCYQEPIIGINSKTQGRKGLNFSYKRNGITSFKKHVDAKHIIIVKMFEKEVNSLLKGRKKR